MKTLKSIPYTLGIPNMNKAKTFKAESYTDAKNKAMNFKEYANMIPANIQIIRGMK